MNQQPNITAKSIDRIPFGFLFDKVEVHFSHGSIVPTAKFEVIAKSISKLIYKDGYLYPPLEQEIRINSDKGSKQTIFRSKRPAHLFRLPPSHELSIFPDKPETDVRKESAAFILYLLALLFQTRLQFSDWAFDGRISIHPESKRILASYPVILGNQLSHAYKLWSRWKNVEQKRFLNILYLFSRTEIYEWDWEKFLFQYVILDACWKMGKDLFQFKAKKHSDRAAELYGHFGVKHPILDQIKNLADLRNDLFHEASWHKGRPGQIGLGEHRVSYDPGIALWWLNRCVIKSFLELEWGD